jgi:hypothetical protein
MGWTTEIEEELKRNPESQFTKEDIVKARRALGLPLEGPIPDPQAEVQKAEAKKARQPLRLRLGRGGWRSALISALKEAGANVTEEDIDIEETKEPRVIMGKIYSSTALVAVCKRCRQPLAGGDIERHVLMCRELEGKGLLPLFRSPGLYAGVDVDEQGNIVCSLCGEKIGGPKHFVNNGHGLECPKIEAVRRWQNLLVQARRTFEARISEKKLLLIRKPVWRRAGR